MWAMPQFDQSVLGHGAASAAKAFALGSILSILAGNFGCGKALDRLATFQNNHGRYLRRCGSANT